MIDLSQIDFAKGGGVITVVTQDARTGAVLMVAQADREALERTIHTREMHYRSRSRGLWHKGATSGNIQRVVTLVADCDGDAVLAQVTPVGPSCHTGTVSCFGNLALGADALGALAQTIAARVFSLSNNTHEPSYTRRLLTDRNLRLKKLGEEAAELVTACADGDPAKAAEEGLDVLYHVLVALAALGVSLDDLRSLAAVRASTQPTMAGGLG
ncbi:MAG: bifunctional phosphoribosyl-AMP cyclohydrolase/phosphoribosyl-ATP diphosphatase HisIE [Chloroflexota bacterium]